MSEDTPRSRGVADRERSPGGFGRNDHHCSRRELSGVPVSCLRATITGLGSGPGERDMPPEDFWNIAGRAGRVDQGDLGVVALAAEDDAKQQVLEQFIDASVGELNSTLIEMVQTAANAGSLLRLESLSHQPAWSAFVQYLAHTYRQIGNHEQFAAQVEQVLRGTLGFQSLRKSHKGWADSLVQGVYAYAQRIKGKPLSPRRCNGVLLGVGQRPRWEGSARRICRTTYGRPSCSPAAETTFAG